jgi:tetratricopeptide (TPR) repeat protein
MMPSKIRNLKILICCGLAAVTLAAYWQVRRQEFVNYDDVDYVTGNPHVQSGMSVEGVVWAFTGFHSWNWHPLTWLSHMLDCQLFGLDAGAHKLVNVAFHIGCTVLLFLVLNRMTAAPWRSAFVAAAFALHPLRVESVAWVSERKDVLSVFFWMLTMWAYVRYVERQVARRYLLVLGCFALGLMAKPMLVTLPLVLLLLDVWPLNRMPLDQTREAWRHVLHLVREKLPLFVLSAGCCVATYWAQVTGGPVSAVKSLPLAYRLANVPISYLRYIKKLLLPVHLAVIYPLPPSVALTHALVAAAAIVIVTVLVIRVVRTHPFLAVGWFWYLVTLIPVIGLVQAGDRIIADRFTYVPAVGLLLMAAWGLPALLPPTRHAQAALRAASVAAIVAMMYGTWHQVRYWQNSVTLFEHALAVTSGNYPAHYSLALALLQQGRVEEAARHLQQAVELRPEYAEANKILADILARNGQLDEAIRHYQVALQWRPRWADAENNLGFALAARGQLQEAITHFSRALQFDPRSAATELNLGVAYVKLKNPDLALTHLLQSLALNSADAQAQYLAGMVLEERGQPTEAVKHLAEAVRLKPGYAEARAALDRLSQ